MKTDDEIARKRHVSTLEHNEWHWYALAEQCESTATLLHTLFDIDGSQLDDLNKTRLNLAKQLMPKVAAAVLNRAGLSAYEALCENRRELEWAEGREEKV